MPPAAGSLIRWPGAFFFLRSVKKGLGIPNMQAHNRPDGRVCPACPVYPEKYTWLSNQVNKLIMAYPNPAMSHTFSTLEIYFI